MEISPAECAIRLTITDEGRGRVACTHVGTSQALPAYQTLQQ